MSATTIVERAQRSVRQAAGSARRAVLARQYRGTRYACPVCGGGFDNMMDTRSGRPQAKCPRCNAFERHRILWLYLQRETDLLTAPHSLLHFAPETCLSPRFRKLSTLDYTTTDLYAPGVDVTADITDLPFPDGSIDRIICNHVLEHVQDDATAIGELARVLRPGGVAVMQHPIDMGRETTFEDASVTSPEERDRMFYQYDHVRIYGRDFAERLVRGGFDIVESIQYQDTLTPEDRELYRVDQLPSRRPERDIEASRIWVVTPTG